MTTTPTHHVRRMAAFTLLSWLGNYIHHRVELPQLTLLSPEHFIPIVISIVLFCAWWQLPYRRLTMLVLLGWAFFPQFLLGGILSVLPLSFWPFEPPQTLQHYVIHGLYAAAQLPLIVTLVEVLRQEVSDGVNPAPET